MVISRVVYSCQNYFRLRGTGSFRRIYTVDVEEHYEIKICKYLAIKGTGQKRCIRFPSLGVMYTQKDNEKRIREISGKNTQAQEERIKWNIQQKEEFDLPIDI